LEKVLSEVQSLLQEAKGAGDEGTPTKKSQAEPEAQAEVMKQLGPALDNLATTLKSLGESVAGIDRRVAKIEKERMPSNSVDEEGGTEATTSKSSDLWSGVI